LVQTISKTNFGVLLKNCRHQFFCAFAAANIITKVTTVVFDDVFRAHTPANVAALVVAKFSTVETIAFATPPWRLAPHHRTGAWHSYVWVVPITPRIRTLEITTEFIWKNKGSVDESLVLSLSSCPGSLL